MADSTRKLLHKRSELARSMRQFFYAHNFDEAQTPLLVPNPGLEPNLHYFETSFVPDMGAQTKNSINFYLPTSPEYALKKILALMDGPTRIFELSRAFRNGEISKTHQPEFSMLEFYCTHMELSSFADLCFDLLKYLGASQGLENEWAQRSDFELEELFVRFANLSFDDLRKNSDNFSDQFHLIFLNKIEPKLRDIPGQIFLWNYPIEEAMLAKSCQNNPNKAHRFEIFFQGSEIGNAFDELLDKESVLKRCKDHQRQRLSLYGKTPPIDENFLESCQKLSPTPLCGIAMGWDRIIMKLLKISSIEDAIILAHKI